MFHQVEGLVIDKGSHLGHLKWILEEFCKAFFEVDNVKMRFRPSFFPFTEPSLEVDIQCKRDKGEIRFGEGEDWLEILGCGMVHPNVLRNCGLDPDEYQGFAWGMGIDRIAMLKYGMPDLRAFFEADVRWLRITASARSTSRRWLGIEPVTNLMAEKHRKRRRLRGRVREGAVQILARHGRFQKSCAPERDRSIRHADAGIAADRLNGAIGDRPSLADSFSRSSDGGGHIDEACA